jgi:hypothetical protein
MRGTVRGAAARLAARSTIAAVDSRSTLASSVGERRLVDDPEETEPRPQLA